MSDFILSSSGVDVANIVFPLFLFRRPVCFSCDILGYPLKIAGDIKPEFDSSSDVVLALVAEVQASVAEVLVIGTDVQACVAEELASVAGVLALDADVVASVDEGLCSVLSRRSVTSDGRNS